MASTYSSLKIELIGTGDQSGTWGTTTNNNLGDTALGEAITGSVDVAFSSADVSLTLTDTNSTQAARHLRLNLTGTSGGARNLILGLGCQINKQYIVNNGLADVVTIKNTTGSGVAVPAGKTMIVFNNGTNVVDVTTHLSSLTLSSALPIASGGTGSTSTTYVNLTSNVTNTLPVANGGSGATTLTGVVYGNGTSAFTAATGAQIVSAIGSTTVTNATNATTAATATNANQITNSGGWNVTPSGTNLYFNYNGTNIGVLTSTGNFTVIGNVTAYGTV
jgi:hypothetical protein